MSATVPAVAALLADLAARGVELAVDGDRLRYRPAGVVPPDVADPLRACKRELVELIGPAADLFTTHELAVMAAARVRPADVPQVVAAKAAFAEVGGLTLVAIEPAPRPTMSDDWCEVYEERAAIIEFDGNLPRAEAEALALRDIRALIDGAVRPLAPSRAGGG